ncbi:MAG: hypothetical protein KGD63_14120 [Candidatus Lokiarchaeota archaeon]|nr:hypothetical protein [Candidatus Lokiarchaeota archaeon]
MFQPASLKLDSPSPVDERLRNKYIIIYFMIITLSFLPVSFFEYFYIRYLWKEDTYWIFFLFIPLNIFINLYILQLGALSFSFLFLTIGKLIHYPKEGVFIRDINDKDYRYWNLRNMIKKWPLFIMATHPFPWLKNRFTLRFFGVKIGKRTICDNCWISSEFVEIQDNVIIGMGSTILSFGIEQDKFIIKKIIIKSDVLIGAKCVLLPGTRIEKKAKLGALSYTGYNSILKEDSIYIGNPAKLKEKGVKENF